jgi:serine/threonine protein kinase
VRGPHLVEVLDADVDADLPYLVTRFVPGRRLDDLVAESGPLEDDALRLLARGVADALTTLHRAGVVHRDLTPGNVLVLDGSPQVIDLGLAVAADVTAQTRSGLVVGTPGYLAPEQVLGGEVGPAVDVHAWGATVAMAGTGPAARTAPGGPRRSSTASCTRSRTSTACPPTWPTWSSRRCPGTRRTGRPRRSCSAGWAAPRPPRRWSFTCRATWTPRRS